MDLESLHKRRCDFESHDIKRYGGVFPHKIIQRAEWPQELAGLAEELRSINDREEDGGRLRPILER